jgi:hypothetical protein
MQNMYYTGLDVHKRTGSAIGVKDGGGKIHAEGTKPTGAKERKLPRLPLISFETGRQAPIESYVEAHQGPRRQMEGLAGGLVLGLMSEEDAVAFVPNLCGNAR